jgi:N-methylhydantoinase A
MRYVGQSYELTVGLAHGADPRDLFHRRYEQVYGYHDPQSPIEVLQLRLLARVPNPVPGLGLLNGKERPPASRPSHRRPLVHGGQRLEVPVYRRADLVPNERLAGPAVVTQYDTTIFVTPGFDFWLDGYGNIRGEAR